MTLAIHTLSTSIARTIASTATVLANFLQAVAEAKAHNAEF